MDDAGLAAAYGTSYSRAARARVAFGKVPKAARGAVCSRAAPLKRVVQRFDGGIKLFVQAVCRVISGRAGVVWKIDGAFTAARENAGGDESAAPPGQKGGTHGGGLAAHGHAERAAAGIGFDLLPHSAACAAAQRVHGVGGTTQSVQHAEKVPQQKRDGFHHAAGEMGPRGGKPRAEEYGAGFGTGVGIHAAG